MGLGEAIDVLNVLHNDMHMAKFISVSTGLCFVALFLSRASEAQEKWSCECSHAYEPH